MIDTAALREKVLDLAIRGKLVPQDPTDEPASVLLERIHEQKLQMVREGKLKAKDVKDDTIIFKGDDNCYYEKYSDGSVKNIQDEIPFELPAGWAWVRFGTFSINRDSERKPIALSNRKNVKKHYDYYGASGKIDKVDKYIFNEKLLLIGEDGANLVTRSKPIAFFAEGKYWVNNHAHCIDSTNKQYLNYLCCYINAINLEKYITGSAQPKMNQDNMNSILISVPPYLEQERILKQIDSIFNLTNEISINYNDIDTINHLLRSKILELAIQGKLVPQDENNESASVLLERIRAERKAKLGKKYVESYIFKGDDNCYYEKVGKNSVDITESIAFEVPLKWEICRFESIVEMYTGNSINESDKAKKYIGLSDGYNYIATKDISFNHTVNYDNGVKIPYGEPKFKIAYKGDPLLCIEGGSAGRKIAILSEDVCFVNKLCVFHSLGVNKKYLYYYLQSPQFCELLKKNTSGLIGGVSINTLKSLYFMLPPLSEQLRIVCAVEKVFSYIDEIEKSLN